MRHAAASPYRAAASRWQTVALLALIVLVLVGCNRNQGSAQAPADLTAYLPADWKPATDSSGASGFQQINIDGDKDIEWLYFFHYDSKEGASNGPVGGIIYDAQRSDPAPPAAVFVPYRLLPDWRTGKGQGYLGDNTVQWSVVKINPLDGDDALKELVVVGFGPGNVPTRLSLIRWLGEGTGYGVTHFQGDYQVQSLPEGRAADALIEQVVTFSRLNDRSRLCEKVVQTRSGNSTSFTATLPTVVFCTGVPEQPTYPEAVVLAWLETEDDALLASGAKASVQAAVPQKPSRVIALSYPGVATPSSQPGVVSTMIVVSTIETASGEQAVQWLLHELPPDSTQKTSRWRIASAN